jgi:protein-disulfide isomerase
LGVGYFAGLLAAWLFAWRDGFPMSARWLVRLGLVASAVFVSAMYLEGLFCAYCAAVHAGNLAFWLVAETTPAAGASRRPTVVLVATALAVSLGLGLAQDRLKQAEVRRASEDLQASIKQVILTSRDEPREATGRPVFWGRYPLGPAESPIRIVVFTDYECGFCWYWDRELLSALAADPTIALSVKHFPLCPECNPALKAEQFHLHACRAAWAAEAGGLLRGNDGFWALHRWLFARGGKFTDEQLTAALPGLGFADSQKFLEAMKSPEVRAAVERDAREAQELGAVGTPLIYINGVPLSNRISHADLPGLLATLKQEDLPSRSPQFDRPPLVVERDYQAWRMQTAAKIPADKSRWTSGPADAAIRVVVFLDCHQRSSAQMAAQARQWVAARKDLRFECFHFPFTVEAHAPSRLVEAAGRVGGQDAFWRLHDWFCEKGEGSTTDDALAAAESQGLNREKLAAEFAADAVTAAVDADIQLGAACGVKGAPRLYINGRVVDQLNPSTELLERILEGAKNAGFEGTP